MKKVVLTLLILGLIWRTSVVISFHNTLMTLQAKKEQAFKNKNYELFNKYDNQFWQIANPDNHNFIDKTISKILY